MLEILVIDGKSTDRTREIVEQYVKRHSFVRLLDNHKRILASAWNIGIRNSQGEIIMALNAHGVFRKEYISKCVKYLKEYDADYVGGIIITTPRNDTEIERGIATALSHPFGVGNSYFRIGSERPTWADTAAFGGYRKGIFEKTGLFNEELARSQDMEFHLRLKKAGGRILLAPDMVCDYYIRSSFKEFCRDYFINGFWAIYPFKFAAMAVSWRHLIPLMFVMSLMISSILWLLSSYFKWILLFILGLYVLINLCFSFNLAFKKRNPQYILLMPLLFTILHLGYGLGSFYAGVKVLGSRKIFKNIKIYFRA
jgi:GT2 family glycosyltransferase